MNESHPGFDDMILLAGHWMPKPKENKENERMYITSDDLLIIQESLQRLKNGEGNARIGSIDRILTNFEDEFNRRSRK